MRYSKKRINKLFKIKNQTKKRNKINKKKVNRKKTIGKKKPLNLRTRTINKKGGRREKEAQIKNIKLDKDKFTEKVEEKTEKRDRKTLPKVPTGKD